MNAFGHAGRSIQQGKTAFYKKVVENLAESPGIDPANILITITENHDIDWSFRDGSSAVRGLVGEKSKTGDWIAFGLMAR